LSNQPLFGERTTAVSITVELSLVPLAWVLWGAGYFFFVRRTLKYVSIAGDEWLPKVQSWRSPLEGLGVYFGLAFVGLFLFSIISYPPLPTVTVTGNQSLDGTLVAQTSGYWYVFDKYCTLHAIDSSEVTTVDFSSQGTIDLDC